VISFCVQEGELCMNSYILNKKFMPIASAPHEGLAIKELANTNVIPYGMHQWSEKVFMNYINIINMEGFTNEVN